MTFKTQITKTDTNSIGILKLCSCLSVSLSRELCEAHSRYPPMNIVKISVKYTNLFARLWLRTYSECLF